MQGTAEKVESQTNTDAPTSAFDQAAKMPGTESVAPSVSIQVRGKIGIFTARHRFPPALAMNILLFRISGRRQNIRTGAPYFREKCQIDRSKSV